jgi:hypothetical protein
MVSEKGTSLGSLVLQLTTLALGAAASPLPVVAVLIILITRRARLGSIVLAASWVLGNIIAIAVAVIFAGKLHMPSSGTDLWWEGLVTLLLGIGLVVSGYLSRRGRRMTDDPRPPAWVKSVDDLSPTGAGLVALSNATTSPKNLALAITAGSFIVRADIPIAGIVAASAYYVLIASLSILIPVVLYFLGGQRAVAILRSWRDKVTDNAAAVMEISLFVLGIGLSAKGLFNLLS